MRGGSRGRGASELDDDSAHSLERRYARRSPSERDNYGRFSMPGSDCSPREQNEHSQNVYEYSTTPVHDFYNPNHEWPLPSFRGSRSYHQPSPSLPLAQTPFTFPSEQTSRRSARSGKYRSPDIGTDNSQMNLIGYEDSDDDEHNPNAGQQPAPNKGDTIPRAHKTAKPSRPQAMKPLSSYEMELVNAYETLGLLDTAIDKELDMHHVKGLTSEFMNAFPADAARFRNAFITICQHQKKTFGKFNERERRFLSQSAAPDDSDHGVALHTSARASTASSLAPSATKKEEGKEQALTPKSTGIKQSRKRTGSRASNETDVIARTNRSQPANTPIDTARRSSHHSEINKHLHNHEEQTHSIVPAHDEQDRNVHPRPMSLQEASSTYGGNARIKKRVIDTSSSVSNCVPPPKRRAFEPDEYHSVTDDKELRSPRPLRLHTPQEPASWRKAGLQGPHKPSKDLSSVEEGDLTTSSASTTTGKNRNFKKYPQVVTRSNSSDKFVGRKSAQNLQFKESNAPTSSSFKAQSGATGRSLSKKQQSPAFKPEMSRQAPNPTSSAADVPASIRGENISPGAGPGLSQSKLNKRPDGTAKTCLSTPHAITKPLVDTPSHTFANLLAMVEGRDAQNTLKAGEDIRHVSNTVVSDPPTVDHGWISKRSVGEPAEEHQKQDLHVRLSPSSREPAKDAPSTRSSLLLSHSDKKKEQAKDGRKSSGNVTSTRPALSSEDWSSQTTSGNVSHATYKEQTNEDFPRPTVASGSVDSMAKPTEMSQPTSKLSAPPQKEYPSPSAMTTTQNLSCQQVDKGGHRTTPDKSVAAIETREPPVTSKLSKLIKMTRLRNEQRNESSTNTSHAVAPVLTSGKDRGVKGSQKLQAKGAPKGHEDAKNATASPRNSEESVLLAEYTHCARDVVQLTNTAPKTLRNTQLRSQSPIVTPDVDRSLSNPAIPTNSALESLTKESDATRQTTPVVHLRNILPAPKDKNAEPYFEFSLFEKLWSNDTDASIARPKEPPGHLLTSVENANRQAEDYFMETINVHCNALQLKSVSTESTRSAEDDCMTFSATLAAIDFPNRKLHLEIGVKRYFVDAVTASMRPAPTNTPYISKTMYIVHLYKLVENQERERTVDRSTDLTSSSSSPSDSSSSSSSSSDTESDSSLSKAMYAKKQKRKAQRREKSRAKKSREPIISSKPTTTSFLRIHCHPLPNGRAEAYTTLDAANTAAFSVQIDMSHDKNAKGANLRWQEQNLGDLRRKFEAVKDGEGEARYWRSEFNESGLGGSKFEVLVCSIGVCGPRNI